MRLSRQRSALPRLDVAAAVAVAGPRPETREHTPGRVPRGLGEFAASSGSGEPLPAEVRLALEESFGVPLRDVRVHTDPRSAAVAEGLGARAFTYGTHVFLGPRERPTDLRLMAHEVAHVLQQQGAPTPQRLAPGASADAYEREAERAAAAAQSGARFTVSERTGAARVQRLGLSDILDGLAELAANLPGYTLLTVIIGRNPINMRPVERNFTNLLRGFMGLVFGGELLFQILNRYGVVERIGRWVTDQLDALGLNFAYIRERFNAFTESLSWSDIFSPGDVWRRAQNVFTEPINRIRSLVTRLVNQAITWLKETFMQPLSNFARRIPGYTLVTVLLGRDPFTNAAVARTPLNLVRAFAEFIPEGTEKVNQLVESRALQRAYEWFVAETRARNLTWERVTGTFARAWDTLRLEDVLQPIDTIGRVADIFRPLMSDLVDFARSALLKLVELVFEAAMGAGGARVLAILKRARSTFVTIIQNPVGFLRNLLGAVGQGVRQFMRNILTHLRQGVIAWLTGPVARAGVQMPERWDLRGIIWFVMQILGLTWDRIRQKLVRLMGARAVELLESGFQLIQDIRQRGLVQALRERVTEFFGQLQEAALGGIRTFIQQRLVMAGITQLLSMLNPVGAIIQAIIKTYTTVQFFIQRINQILDLVESIVNSVSAIASGAIGQAANFVERTMARTIPVILDFLARFIGLGDVGGQVQRTIQGLQARVDQMLDRAVDWIRAQAARLGRAAASGLSRVRRALFGDSRVQFTAAGESHVVWAEMSGGRLRIKMASETPRDLEEILIPHLRTRAGQIAAAVPKSNALNQVTRLTQQVGRWKQVLDRQAATERDYERRQLDDRVKEAAQAVTNTITAILGILNLHGAPAFRDVRAEIGQQTGGKQVVSLVRLTIEGALEQIQHTRPSRAVRPAVGSNTVPLLPTPVTAPRGVRPERNLVTPAAGTAYWVLESHHPARERDFPGGVLLQPPSAATPAGAVGSGGGQAPPRSEVEVHTWNTADERLGHHGASHAEAQFELWFREQSDTQKMQIRKIEIHNRHLSPCSTCSELLAGLLRGLKGLQENENQRRRATNASRRQQDPNAALLPLVPPFEVALLFFTEKYNHREVGTTTRDLNMMHREGWRTHDDSLITNDRWIEPLRGGRGR